MADKKKKEELLVKPEPVKEEKVLYTLEEIDKLKKKRIREGVIQGLAVMGLISAVIFYLIVSEFLFEISLFGLMFKSSRTEFLEFWNYVSGYGPGGSEISYQIYDDWFQWGVWVPVAFCTLMELLLTTLMVGLLSYSIKEVINLIKRLIGSSTEMLHNLGEVTLESITTDEMGNKISLTNKITNKITKAKEKKKVKQKKEKDEIDMVLDELLTAPHTEAEAKMVDQIEDAINGKRKSLFEEDEE